MRLLGLPWTATGRAVGSGVVTFALLAQAFAFASPATGAAGGGLVAHLTFGEGVVDGEVSGRAVLIVSTVNDFNVGVTRTDASIFGMDKRSAKPGETIVMQGDGDAAGGVYGFSKAHPEIDGLTDLPSGDYYVRAVFKTYEAITRSDGSRVEVHVPCGDGGSTVYSVGNLTSDVARVTVTDGQSTEVALTFDTEIEPSEEVPSGGTCEQGNPTPPADADGRLQYVKLRSTVLSDFWKRDTYIGANVVLPIGYDDPENADKRYPVIFSQSHWPGGYAFGYSGAPDPEDPEVIMVTLRMETPFYDTSYGVNSANQGPWGDAVGDELVPYLDSTFRTIPERWARAQTGGSTGGWMAVAMTTYRPDLYGSAWAEYPDSLDFNAHQAVDIYGDENAYVDDDGQQVGSWHYYDKQTEDDTVLVTMSEENRYELALGDGSRSFDQWDVWNATFSPQGTNGLPLDPWNKLTGEIDHETTELWRPFDMSDYVGTNWDGTKNLGVVLKNRLNIWVGTEDTFYLDRGVRRFQETVTALGGDDWATFRYGQGEAHGYTPYADTSALIRDIYDYMIADRDDGTENETTADLKQSVGNRWAEVLAHGGHQAALRRAGTLSIGGRAAVGAVLQMTNDGLDPGMDLEYQWLRDGEPIARSTNQAHRLTQADANHRISLRVIGRKLGYDDQTLTSASLRISATTSTPKALRLWLKVTGRPVVKTRAAVRVRALLDGDPVSTKRKYVWRAGRMVIGTHRSVVIPKRALGRRVTVTVTAAAPGATRATARVSLGRVRR